MEKGLVSTQNSTGEPLVSQSKTNERQAQFLMTLFLYTPHSNASLTVMFSIVLSKFINNIGKKDFEIYQV